MIIGNGMIAQAFENAGRVDDAVVFASGVSNSSETSCSEFEREKALLKDCVKKYQGKIIVYFSSCALVDPDVARVPYYKHKLDMEEYIKSSCDYIIIRLPQLVGETHNPHTILNYFKNKIEMDSSVEVQADAYRYFIDINDVVVFVSSLLGLGKVNLSLNFANPVRYSAETVFLTVAHCLGKEDPDYTVVEGGVTYELGFEDMYIYIDDCGQDFEFGESYFQAKLDRMFKCTETFL